MNTWFYNLSQEQLSSIYFTCDEQKLFNEYFGQDPALTRPDLGEQEDFVEHLDRSDEEEQKQQQQRSAFQDWDEEAGSELSQLI